MTTKVVYSVPTGVQDSPQQGAPANTTAGLGMPTGVHGGGSGKRNQSEQGGEEERSLLTEAMEVEIEGVSTMKGKGAERTTTGGERATSPSMHAPKAQGESWQTVGKGGRPLGRSVDRVTANGGRLSRWIGTASGMKKIQMGGTATDRKGGIQQRGACYVCGKVGHYARWCQQRVSTGQHHQGSSNRTQPSVHNLTSVQNSGKAGNDGVTASGSYGGRRWEAMTTTTPAKGKTGEKISGTADEDWKRKVEGMVKVDEFVRSRSDFAMVVDFRGLRMTQLGMIAAVAKGVQKVEGLKFVGAELVEVAFVCEEDLQEAVETGMKIGNIKVPSRRCLGLEEEVVMLEVLEMPIMSRDATTAAVKETLQPWGEVFQVKLLEWMGTSIRTGTAIAMVLLKVGQRMGKDWAGKVLVGQRSCIVRRRAEVGITPVVGSVISKAQMKAGVEEEKLEQAAKPTATKISVEEVVEEIPTNGTQDMTMLLEEYSESEDDNQEEEDILAEVNQTILISEEDGRGLETQNHGENTFHPDKSALWRWLEGQMWSIARGFVTRKRPMEESDWMSMRHTDTIVGPLHNRLIIALENTRSELTDAMKAQGEWGSQLVENIPNDRWMIGGWNTICDGVREEEEERVNRSTADQSKVLDTTLLL